MVKNSRTYIKIVPNDNMALNWGLFDKPAELFALETAILFASLWVYTALAPLATWSGYKDDMNGLKVVVASMVIQQALSCLERWSVSACHSCHWHVTSTSKGIIYRAPTDETRFLCAPTSCSRFLPVLGRWVNWNSKLHGISLA